MLATTCLGGLGGVPQAALVPAVVGLMACHGLPL